MRGSGWMGKGGSLVGERGGVGGSREEGGWVRAGSWMGGGGWVDG